MEPSSPTTRRIFSVGHSNRPMTSFLELLRRHSIEVIVDTRSAPYSKFATQFNQAEIKTSLQKAGWKYLFLGRELGGRPDRPEIYDDEGHVRYDRVAASAAFQEGIERLERGISQYRVALLCSEEDPSGCHRRLLVGRVLQRRGILVEHIRGDGELMREEALAARGKLDPTLMQVSLFEAPKEPPWRSVRPVWPKNRPSGSPER